MPTLFEILRNTFLGPPAPPAPQAPPKTLEEQVYNPIGVKIKSYITLDDLDYLGKQFSVQEIAEHRHLPYERGQAVRKSTSTVALRPRFVDYRLWSEDLHSETTVWLRLSPVSKPPYYRLLLLKLYHDCGYSDDFAAMLKDEYFTFDREKIEFGRCGGVRTPHPVSVTYLTDDNHDGQIDLTEQRERKLEYCDYSAMVTEEGQEKAKYLFIEKDSITGAFSLKWGSEIAATAITVI